VPTKLYFQIDETVYKNRLDRFLYKEITAVSRMYLAGLLKDEKCLVNGETKAAGYHLKAGDAVEIEVDLTRETAMMPEDISLEIIFEDAEILVVNKPPGMLVHPTKGVRNGTLLNALTYHLNYAQKNVATGNFIRAGLVHRLDKKTSGLMIVAKNPRSHRILCRHFQNKLVEKKYFALVEGLIEEDYGTINAPIGRDAEQRIWLISDKGKEAETNFRVIKKTVNATLLELEPVTGRTNQLRLHLAHLKHPIVGDDKYGGRVFSRLCLHAYRLSFYHPAENNRMNFEIGLPNDFPI
jgi:23S rRNA pseudouridine1911/1915/1917 synthase